MIFLECSQLVRECDEPMLGLSKLILGCANNINKEYDNAIKSLRECLNLRKNVYKSSDDMHITAFAQYELGALLLRNEEVYFFKFFKTTCNHELFTDKTRRKIIVTADWPIQSV